MQSFVRTSALGVVLVAVLVPVACSDPGGGSEDSGSADGEALYEANCASCHGADLRGTDQGPSHLSIVYEPGHHSDEAFRSAIVNGAPQHHWSFGPMPPVEGLDDDDIEAIISYVRDEQQRRGFES